MLSDYILVVLAWHGSQVAMVCPLPVPGDLQVTLTMMVLLITYMVGINQLNSFYAGSLDRDANLDFITPLLGT